MIKFVKYLFFININISRHLKLEIASAIPTLSLPARGSAFDVRFDPRAQRVNWVRSTTPC